MYHLEAPGPLRQLWEQDAGKGSDTDSRLTAAPVVADGKIYVLDSEAHVFAFDAQHRQSAVGREHRAARRERQHRSTSACSGPTTASIRPRASAAASPMTTARSSSTSGFGDVVALDARSGKKLWTQSLGVPIVNAPAANGGRVFVSTAGQSFLRAGAERRPPAVGSSGHRRSRPASWKAPAPRSRANIVIAPYSSGEIYALRVQNGRPAWNDMLTHSGVVTALSELDDIAGRPVIDRDVVLRSAIRASWRRSTSTPATGCGRAISAASRRLGRRATMSMC